MQPAPGHRLPESPVIVGAKLLPVEAQLSPGLKASGFKKKARTWTRETPDAFQVVNLQKSQFSEQVYVNVAVYLKALGDETSPPEHRCHIRARLERIAPESLSAEIRSLNAALPMSASLLSALLELAVSWLERVSSRPGLDVFVGSSMARHCFVDVKVRAHLTASAPKEAALLAVFAGKTPLSENDT